MDPIAVLGIIVLFIIFSRRNFWRGTYKPKFKVDVILLIIFVIIGYAMIGRHSK